ncbi:hypothetical protein LXL04_020729 [Taraxacum kok-saghyz]
MFRILYHKLQTAMVEIDFKGSGGVAVITFEEEQYYNRLCVQSRGTVPSLWRWRRKSISKGLKQQRRKSISKSSSVRWERSNGEWRYGDEGSNDVRADRQMRRSNGDCARVKFSPVRDCQSYVDRELGFRQCGRELGFRHRKLLLLLLISPNFGAELLLLLLISPNFGAQV